MSAPSFHVTLVANYLPDEQESMQRYAALLRQVLEERGDHVEVLRPPVIFGRLKRSGQGIGKWLGYLDKFILFPFMLRAHIWRRRLAMKAQGEKGGFLVHVCDHSNAMYTRWLKDVPHLVTCHDVLAIESALGLIPEHRTRWSGRVLQRWILGGLRRARQVVCVSAETRRHLLALAPELEPRCTIIENALQYPFSPMPPEEARGHLKALGLDGELGLETKRFIFHVGGNQWYKNREGLLRIFARFCAAEPELVRTCSLKLVMAGKSLTAEMLQFAEREGIAGKILLPGTVSDEQLRAFYSRAAVLLFPSLQEGFGWPLVEAQACGCPVITSERSPMKEVAGPAAFLAHPEEESDFVARLREALTETPELRKLRKKEGQHHAQAFTPSVFTRRTVETYALLIKSAE